LKKVNFANVRSATKAIIAAALAAISLTAASPAAQGASPSPRVTVALLPDGTGPRELGRVEGISPGLVSAGIGKVPASQTYLDVSQGNRTSPSLYDDDPPLVYTSHGRVPRPIWDTIVDRARDVPADVVPGLLASTLLAAGVGARAEPSAGLGFLIAVDRRGRVRGDRGCPAVGCTGLTVRSSTVGGLRRLVGLLRGKDMLIALERPPPRSGHQLTAGVAGSGFDGRLTSESTRLRGLVLSSDLAPTILRRLGVRVPSEMSGTMIRAEGEPDAGEVGALEDRIEAVGPRRGPVIGTSFLIWSLLMGLAAAAFRSRGARVALPLLALSGIYIPALLLVGAALEPSETAERLIVGLGAPAAAAVTLLATRGYWALATASAVSVLACAIDVIAGSPLTPLSLMGPSPALGVRFFGIGNELEATIAVLVPVGVGAAAAARGSTPRAAAAWFAAAAVLAVLVFAPGRFGADVGAAIVLPVGGAVAALAVLGPAAGGRRAIAIVAAPLVALAALAALDLALGGGAHLTRSVLDAGGLDQVGEIAERRLRLSAVSFSRAIVNPLLYLVLTVIVAGLVLRRRLVAWLGERALIAGFAGAAAATALGTLSNDSGALLLMIGTAYLTLVVGYAWTRGDAGA
jgi:hypothetical protein